MPTDLSAQHAVAVSDAAVPEANLSDLFPGKDSQEFKDAMTQVKIRAGEIDAAYRGKIHALTGDELAGFLEKLDRLETLARRIGIYAGLLQAKNASGENNKFLQDTNDALKKINEDHLLFIGINLKAMPEDAYRAKLAGSKALRKFEPYLESTRKYGPHTLDEAGEDLLSKFSGTSRDRWVALFNERQQNRKYDFNGEGIGNAALFDQMDNLDPEVRRKAYEAHGKALAEDSWFLVANFNAMMDFRSKEDMVRKYEKPWSARNLKNAVSDHVLETMTRVITEGFSRMSHPYYETLRQELRQEKLNPWDRNAPIDTGVEEKRYSWEDAQEIVLEAFGRVSPQMQEIARMFFDKKWIDARSTEGKNTGAFSASCTHDTHPYVFMNFKGKARDVMVLAHELGHGVHQWLEGREVKSQLLMGTPLTMAETASIFGEMLTFDILVERTPDPTQRKMLIAGKMKDMINTVGRQMAFHNFEAKAHQEFRDSGDLTEERLNAIFMETQKELLGDAFELGDEYGSRWSYIPHFVHTPFYVYAYAFGDYAVNALFNTYKNAQDKPKFVRDYIDFLKTSSVSKPEEAYAKLGVDIQAEEFWRNGISFYERMMERLRDALAEEKALKPKSAGPAVQSPAP